MLRHFVLLLLVLEGCTQIATAQHVNDPKASVINVPQRMITLRATKVALLRNAIKGLAACVVSPEVPAPAHPMKIPHHYLVGSHGPSNPAEADARHIYETFETRVTGGMNRYLATGSHAEAACSLAQLDLWAKGQALLDYEPFENHGENIQSWYQTEWTLASAGITLSVLVNDPDLDQAQVAEVRQWLTTSAHRMISFEKPNADGNNHHYWRGCAATAIGVVAADDDLYDYGVRTYKQAINQIDANGAFPLEMERHEKAIHYQAFALQPLILIAAFSDRQGLDLFSYAANGRTLGDAIDFLGKAISDPQLLRQYTSDKVESNLSSSEFAPFAFFKARFPSKALPVVIGDALKKPLSASRIGGSTTIFAVE